MNSKQLRWILSSDPITRKTFVDVYARDEIKLINSVAFPSTYIFNFDPSTKPGLHWVAVYFHSNRTENISNHSVVHLFAKLNNSSIPMQKNGNTIDFKFKNYIQQHVDNFQCFTFTKNAKD